MLEVCVFLFWVKKNISFVFDFIMNWCDLIIWYDASRYALVWSIGDMNLPNEFVCNCVSLWGLFFSASFYQESLLRWILIILIQFYLRTLPTRGRPSLCYACWKEKMGTEKMAVIVCAFLPWQKDPGKYISTRYYQEEHFIWLYGYISAWTTMFSSDSGV